jgi:hypothetical protein
MILVWNNMNSFKRHLEDMRLFRQGHNNMPTEEVKIFKDMPLLFNVKPPRETGIIRSLTNNKGITIFVPIRKMTLTRGSEN